ncbi:hypothetical protein P3X46_028154 [Hevea brasiliensis]|uniref:Pentatricopeptide repeat-containing protein n=1 Tax=Hevea brasiliensis TaxID=3981 RepID=A0ABQ9KNR0_HEVBR|nr:hypothetical protein P3X46_028154 [Hevea brasiliensis]
MEFFFFLVKGHTWSLFAHNSLFSMHAKTAELEIACCLFDKMPDRDAVSWNAMISGYASKGMWKEAFELFGKNAGRRC